MSRLPPLGRTVALAALSCALVATAASASPTLFVGPATAPLLTATAGHRAGASLPPPGPPESGDGPVRAFDGYPRLANAVGWASIASWILVYTDPEPGSDRVWLTGDITNFLGSIWQALIPTVIILALYYTVCDVILIFQVFYYRRKRRLHPELYEPLAISDGLNGNGGAALPTPASEQTPLLSAFSAHAPTEPAFSPAVQRARDLLFYGAGIAIIVSAGVIAWFAGKNKSKEGRVIEEWDTSAQVVGWVSAFLYLGSRLPQLALNRKTKCVGLSIFMFLLAVVGNSTYVASILLTSTSPQHLLINAPWLVGSGGTIALDFIVLGQFAFYAKERRLEAEAAKNGVFAADDDALARREVFEDDDDDEA
ncbi:cystinosin/ERS1p repeat protein [Rhodotorula toruloides]|uniref:Cystinosin/ERS1p repeat protein n=1 Tax=Rhodotorula toruloides TaxID=5286 RepID=A0A511KIV7_RHOTO|nr:cystinosin/ERS1p repeat protein [Rhodotorula toruloides]